MTRPKLSGGLFVALWQAHTEAPVRRIVYAILVLGLCSSDALADALAGASKAQICVACHNPQHRLAAMPLLEGQPAEYLYVQLKAYKDGRRLDPTMTMPPSAANLSDLDMREISAFFAAQTAPSVAYQVDSNKVASGRTKSAALGCENCHRADRNATAAVPRLAGQAGGYSTAQLHAFTTGKRSHGAGSNAAPPVILNGADIEDLANYFAQLK
jgi:cytochrome c553